MPNPFHASFGVSPPLLVSCDGVLKDFVEARDDGPGASGRATLYWTSSSAGPVGTRSCCSSWVHKLGGCIPPKPRSPSRTRAPSHTSTAPPGSPIHEQPLSTASDIDKSFLLAMAHGRRASKMADIWQSLNAGVNYTSQYRLRLIAAELIYRTRHGDVDLVNQVRITGVVVWDRGRGN